MDGFYRYGAPHAAGAPLLLILLVLFTEEHYLLLNIIYISYQAVFTACVVKIITLEFLLENAVVGFAAGIFGYTHLRRLIID